MSRGRDPRGGPARIALGAALPHGTARARPRWPLRPSPIDEHRLYIHRIDRDLASLSRTFAMWFRSPTRRPARPAPTACRFLLESLEDRSLMSVSPFDMFPGNPIAI